MYPRDKYKLNILYNFIISSVSGHANRAIWALPKVYLIERNLISENDESLSGCQTQDFYVNMVD